MIHLYYGDGQGKTTAAMGLALRMAGRDQNVVIAQFLKGADSGERLALPRIPRITLLEVPEQVKFTFALTPEERQEECLRARALLEEALRLATGSQCGLLVLDEVCDAVDTGLLPLSALLEALDALPCEAVLTGHDPDPLLLERAHYLTRFEKIRHPFDGGQCARCGIEY